MKGYRTIILQAVTLVVAILVSTGFLSIEDAAVVTDNSGAVLDAATNPTNTEYVVAGVLGAIAIANTVLRVLTTSKIGEKK